MRHGRLGGTTVVAAGRHRITRRGIRHGEPVRVTLRAVTADGRRSRPVTRRLRWPRRAGRAAVRAARPRRAIRASRARADAVAGAKSAAAAGLGVGVIPGLAVAHPVAGVAVRPLGPGAPGAADRGRAPAGRLPRPAVASMLACLRAAAAELGHVPESTGAAASAISSS